MFRSLILVLLLPLMASCGFALRQAAPLPALATTLTVDGDPSSALVRELETELELAGATIGSGGGNLKIVADSSERQIISLDDRAKVGEYELHYRVVFSYRGADGAVLVSDTPIEFSRVYSFDEQQAIGAAQEEETIRTELRRDAVRAIIERLGRLPR
jgi:LPS-assembly lipoprotein